MIGPNGAGKTTIISVLAGLRRPTAGTVTLAVDRRKMAVLVDTPQFEPWLTAAEVVELARRLTAPGLSPTRVEQALAEVDLREAPGPVGGFSRGMLQRLGLAACLVGDPALLILDEPCSALDPAGRREVLDLIGRLPCTTTVVLSTHSLADVQQVYKSRISKIRRGADGRELTDQRRYAPTSVHVRRNRCSRSPGSVFTFSEIPTTRTSS